MIAIYLYTIFTTIAQPLATLYIKMRLQHGKEDKERYLERFAQTNQQRPDGKLLWFHAASIGELNIIIPLLREFYKNDNTLKFLVTTATVSAAKVFAMSNLPNAIHQYAPVDTPAVAKRFIEYWRPNIAVFTESELWPNLLFSTHYHGVPMVLVNARLSDTSFKNWKWFRGSLKTLLQLFNLVLAGTQIDRQKFSYFEDSNTYYIGNLKNASPPISANTAMLSFFKENIGNRRVVVCASTHSGEEEIILKAQLQLKINYPDLLVIIAPRHTNRANEVAELAENLGLLYLMHSEHPPQITKTTDLYIVNTVGELGTFYRLGTVAFVGGSLVKHGGHNVLEPGKLGCVVLTGPYTFNFTEIVQMFTAANAIITVHDANDFAATIQQLFENPEQTAILQQNALQVSQKQQDVIQQTIAYIMDVMQEGSGI